MAYTYLKVSLLCHLVVLCAADIVDDLQLLTANEDNSEKTPAVKCFYKNQGYEVGAKFADDTCSELCTCLVGGHLHCVPLCVRSSTPGCTSDSHVLMKQIPSKDPTGRCKCHRLTCMPRPQAPVGKCNVDGKQIDVGQQFADSHCAGWCTCLPGGNVMCQPLCPRRPSPLCSGVSSQRHPEMVPSRDPTGKCKCLRLVCELSLPEICSYKGKYYNIGEKFADSTCTSYCTCKAGGGIGCVSMCPPVATPLCAPGTHLLIKEFPSADPTGRCKCNHAICAQKQTGQSHIGGCLLEGQSYKPNQDFIDQKCLGRCRCLQNGAVMCFPLCPRSGVKCTLEEQVKGRRTMDNEGRCFCRCNKSSIVI